MTRKEKFYTTSSGMYLFHSYLCYKSWPYR